MKRFNFPPVSCSMLALILLSAPLCQGADTIVPTIKVLAPTTGQQVTNSSVTVRGNASDNQGVAAVWIQANGGDWISVKPINGWTNWTAAVPLSPGPNTIKAYAVDTTGHKSKTNSVSLTYVVNTRMTVGTNGNGTVSPNYNGQWLQVGKSFTMTAKAAKGFSFTGWTGSIKSSAPGLKFVVAADSTYIANFRDSSPPILVITAPSVGKSYSANSFTIQGGVKDNVGVSSVWCRVNGMEWSQAILSENGSNWMANAMLISSGNVVEAYAIDSSGNHSATNKVKFTNNLLPASLAGLEAIVTPDGGTSFAVDFGTGTYSQMDTSADKTDNNRVGNYTFSRLSGSSALLSIAASAPPDVVDHASKVLLNFTGPGTATFVTTNGDGMLDTGTVMLTPVATVAPASLSGRTINYVGQSDEGQIVLGASTFTRTGSGSGTYTYTRYSPVGGMIVFRHSSGEVDYVLVDFQDAHSGMFLVTSYSQPTDQPNVSAGTFTLP